MAAPADTAVADIIVGIGCHLASVTGCQSSGDANDDDGLSAIDEGGDVEDFLIDRKCFYTFFSTGNAGYNTLSNV